jgi:hypothetical protein
MSISKDVERGQNVKACMGTLEFCLVAILYCQGELTVWLYVLTCVSLNFEIFLFFLLKLNAVCTFWIVLMC